MSEFNDGGIIVDRKTTVLIIDDIILLSTSEIALRKKIYLGKKKPTLNVTKKRNMEFGKNRERKNFFIFLSGKEKQCKK